MKIEEEWIYRYLDFIKNVKGYAPLTIINYESKLLKIWESTGNDVIEKITLFGEDNKDLSNATFNQYITIWSSFLKFCKNENLIQEEVNLTYKFAKKTKTKEVKILTDKQIYKIINATKSTEEYLALKILIESGIRISEFDYFNKISDWVNEEMITIKGKSKTNRIVPISDKWVELASKCTKETLLPESYSGKDKFLKRIGKETKLSLNFHLFRSTFATNWMDKGGNLFLLMIAMGHSSLDKMKPYLNANVKAVIRQWKELNFENLNYSNRELLQAKIKNLTLENERLTKELNQLKENN